MRARCLPAVVLLSCATMVVAQEMIPSHLGHQGPAFTPGTTPSKLGWGSDGQACPDRFVVNPQDGAEMVWVPAGEFTMGSLEGEGDQEEHPQHTVMLSGFWLDKTEVTNEQYGKFVAWMKRTGDHSKCFKEEPAGKDHTPLRWTDEASMSMRGMRTGPKQPVVGVDWYDAYAYAAWASKRLPTEAQWEKAARGTDGRRYPWGDDWDGSKCNSSESGKRIAVDVGSYPEGRSPHGCLDMAGNVWEWCADWDGPGYYKLSPRENPTGSANGSSRLLRGGSWSNSPFYCRSACRFGLDPVNGVTTAGFRCARTP